MLICFRFRNFGELVEFVCTNRPDLQLPLPLPGSVTSPTLSLINTVSNVGSLITEQNVPIFGPFSMANPILTVQHAGCNFYFILDYFLTAAHAADERWKRFLKSADVSLHLLILAKNPFFRRKLKKRS